MRFLKKVMCCAFALTFCFFVAACTPKNQNEGGNPPPKDEEPTNETFGEPLSLSHEGGIYPAPFTLKVTREAASHKIFYTLDGSEPTENSIRYQGGISIQDNSASRSYPLTQGVVYDSAGYGTYNFKTRNECTVLRLMEIDNSGRIVRTRTETYFVRAQGDFTLPVISLILPEEDALSFYNDVQNESKTRAELEYFDFASNEQFARNTQIKVGGNWTKGFPYRTMNVNFSKNEDGEKNLPVTQKLFQDRKARNGGALTDFTRFRLHSGGNAQTLNWFGDAFTQKVAAEVDADGKYLDVATTAYRPVEVYLNGEYWGLYAMREHYSDVYFAQNYGVNKDDVILIDKNYNIGQNPDAYTDKTVYNSFYSFEVAENSERKDGMTLATELFDFLYNTNLSSSFSYRRFEEMVDVDSLIDMVLVHFYAGNWDFMNNNIKMWRTATVDESNPYADGKWRFCLHDLDFSFEFQWGDNGLVDANGYTLGANYLDYFLGKAYLNYNGLGFLGSELTCLLSSPMRNASFRERLKERAGMLKKIYSDGRAQRILDDMASEIRTPMARHLTRWGRSDYDESSWEFFVKRTKDVLRDRPYMRDEMNVYSGGYVYRDGDYFERQIDAAIERFLQR